MTKKSKDQNNGTHHHAEKDQEQNEKLFDFEGTFEDADEDEMEANSGDSSPSNLEATVSELKDKHLRLLAEFDNYKKRTTRERLDLMNSASKEVIVGLLPILDDFDRARKSAIEGSKGEHWSEGVNLVYNRLYNMLQSFGLKAMESNGQAFDPDLHEAITEIQAPNPELSGKIIDTVEKGYTLNDKIIRHAKVVVGK